MATTKNNVEESPFESNESNSETLLTSLSRISPGQPRAFEGKGSPKLRIFSTRENLSRISPNQTLFCE
jgi:hypothetical protein